MKCLRLSLLTAIAWYAALPAQTSFYNIGNSYSDHLNGTPAISLSLVRQLDWGRHMIPGAPLSFIWDNPTGGFETQGYYPEALPNKAWDFVSLQLWDESAAKGSEAAINFSGLAYEGNPDVVILLLATSSTGLMSTTVGEYHRIFEEDDVTHRGSRAFFEKVVDNIRAAYPGKTIGMIPVQHVFAEIDRRLKSGESIPEVSSIANLTDGHFNDRGRYLACLTAYCTMFAEGPHGAITGTYYQDQSVSQTFAEYAWDLVWDVVSGEPYAQLVADPGLPIAAMSPSVTLGDGPFSVAFDASVSRDPDGSIVSYAWDFGDGSTGSGETATHTFDPGVYRVTLTVTDNDTKTALTAKYIQVRDPGASGNVFLEAECARIGSNWVMVESPDASMGMMYTIKGGLNSTTSAPSGVEDRIRFTFSVPSGGSYNVFARVSAPTKSDDSFYARANEGSWVSWNNIGDGGAGLCWARVESSFALNAGENTVDFAYREDGAGLDKIWVTTSSQAPTGFGLPSVNCIVDTVVPTAPTSLQLTDVLVNGATLSWTAAGDNVAVSGYAVYKDGVLAKLSSALWGDIRARPVVFDTHARQAMALPERGACVRATRYPLPWRTSRFSASSDRSALPTTSALAPNS